VSETVHTHWSNDDRGRQFRIKQLRAKVDRLQINACEPACHNWKVAEGAPVFPQCPFIARASRDESVSKIGQLILRFLFDEI
jgi:hypothetical protein